MEAQNLIDVRSISPRLKHPVIFQLFDKLNTGEHLTILNDHDPMPLYYQFQAKHPGQFAWQYLEKGPYVWKVAITKISRERTVADVV